MSGGLQAYRFTDFTFTVFVQTLNFDLDCLVRVIGKTLTLPKHKDNAKNYDTNKRKTELPCFK